METKRPTNPEAEEILGGYFPALDHGFISLKDYMGNDEAIEQAARVSYGFGTRKTTETKGLLRYLRRHMHTTPSEMVELKFHCCMPIFIARQWIRHRTANVNEQSGRYSLLPMIFYTPDQAHLQTHSKTNKQGQSGDVVQDQIHKEAVDRWNIQRTMAADNYAWLNDHEVAKELARIDLPLSTYTQWYWKIDLHNLLHFLTLRCDSHAQYEIRVFSNIMAGMVKKIAPISYEAWIDYDLCGVKLSRMEMEFLTDNVNVQETHSTIYLEENSFKFEMLKAKGLNDREIGEFIVKLNKDYREVPDFTLDLSNMVSGEIFAERFGVK